MSALVDGPSDRVAGQGPTQATGEESDPLLELARIMEEQNAFDDGAAQSTDDRQQPDFEDLLSDPLDFGDDPLGLEDDIAAPGNFAAQDIDAGDLEDALLSDATRLEPSFDAGDILSDLDFAAPQEAPAASPIDQLDQPDRFNQPGEPDLAVPPLLAASAAAAAGAPSLSAHLTPRAPVQDPAPQHAPQARVDEDALLAAMDDFDIDSPHDALDGPDSAPRSPAEADDFAFDAQDDAPENAKGGRKVIFALAAVAVVGLFGVVAFGLFAGDDPNDGAPQLIASTVTEDDKVEPVADETREAQPGDAVFETLEETATGADGPRVILPAPGVEASTDAVRAIVPSADIAPAPAGATTVRPVRTVTVRADGSVVETPAETAAQTIVDAAQAVTPSPVVQLEAAEPRAVEVIAVGPGNGTDQTTPNGVELPALAPATQDVTNQSASVVPPLPVARPANITPQAVQSQPIAVTPLPAQTAPVQAAPVQTAPVQAAPVQTQTTQPIQLAAPTAAPATQAAPVATAPVATAPVASGDFVVQLASLRSDEQARATFNTLQGRFGSILSSFAPNVQRVDLGDRGIYHRLRVGPMDRVAADGLCRRYQSAGGDCFVQRR